MVPVPDQLEARVREFVAQRTASGDAGWSEEVVARLYEQLDGPSRTAIETIARGVVDDEPVTLANLAKGRGNHDSGDARDRPRVSAAAPGYRRARLPDRHTRGP